MKKSLLFSVAHLIGMSMLYAQTPSTTIATWKNDAKGAYNIIHDDFGDGGVIGIQDYADTMHFNRGLKFTFGAITSACEADPAIYVKAKAMITDHGHEIINHSHTHSCAIGSANCGGTGDNYEWAVAGNTNAFNIEVDYAHNSIQTGTGYAPRFYIFPYDQFNNDANVYLQSKGYLGSRTGAYNAAADFDFGASALGFFKTPLVVDVATVGANTNAINLNYWVDQAIANNQWVNRELHNVGNTGWGSVSVANYRTHLNYVKSKVVAGDLWVGTISEILTYQIQKLHYAAPTTVYSALNKDITITWPTPSFDVSTYLSTLQVKSPVTIKLDLDGLSALDYTITQSNNIIANKTIKNGVLYFDAYPHEGSITVTLVQCPALCITAQPVNKTIAVGGSTTFSVNAGGASGITYQWFKNNQEIPNAIGATFSLSNIQLADSGYYSVKVSAGIAFETSTSAKLTVIKTPPATTPYKGSAFVIPCKIEAEDFDNGASGVAYSDVSNYNEGSAFYRDSEVDIDVCNDGAPCYNLGYTEAGEWLKYTVDVSESKNYNIEFRYATTFANSSAKLYMNDVAITGTLVFPSTTSWVKYKSYSVKDVFLTAGTGMTLKLQFPTSNADINYMNFTPGTIITSVEPMGVEIKMKLYPNPAHHAFVIEGIAEGQVQLIAFDGTVVKEYVIEPNQTSLQVTDYLSQGIYMVKFTGAHTTVSTKLVKL